MGDVHCGIGLLSMGGSLAIRLPSRALLRGSFQMWSIQAVSHKILTLQAFC